MRGATMKKKYVLNVCGKPFKKNENLELSELHQYKNKLLSVS